jgi:hypothetical protein
MKTQVEFRSSKFPPYEGEEEQINPGLWGKRLAEEVLGSSLVISHLGLTFHWSGRALGIFSLRGSLYFGARR